MGREGLTVMGQTEDEGTADWATEPSPKERIAKAVKALNFIRTSGEGCLNECGDSS